MTLLGKDVSEGTSYLELAEFLARRGDPDHIQEDLEQLFRRVVFNVAVGNRDDHLRNHGFILGKRGWRLSPAFDVNPSIDKATHVLSIDAVVNVVGDWKAVARRAKIAAADIELSASAFVALER